MGVFSRALALVGLLSGSGLCAAEAAPLPFDAVEAMLPAVSAQAQYACDQRGCWPVRSGYSYGRPRGYGDEGHGYGYGHGHGHGYGYGYPHARSRPGQLTPPAGMTWQEYEAYRAGSSGG
jgi:hypothetical protein